VGRKPITGKRKGGIKVHTQINLQENVPKLIWFSSATTHDKQFLKHIKLEKGRIAVFDKGYNDYKTFDAFTEKGVFFVTLLKQQKKLYNNAPMTFFIAAQTLQLSGIFERLHPTAHTTQAQI
jgi:hypothetical protein